MIIAASNSFPVLPTSSFGAAVLLIALLGFTIFRVVTVAFDPLKHIPGPFAARFTRLWELQKVNRGDFEKTHIQLHEKYGPIVRLGPNRYSILSADVVKTVYVHGSKFVKSKFYHPFGNPDRSKPDLFTEERIDAHAANRRKLAALYSVTTLISYEPYVDKCNELLCTRLQDFASEGRSLNMPTWLQYYAFDVIGEISVGESFGLLRSGVDHDGILAAIHSSMVYGAVVGLLPELHPKIVAVTTFLKMPIPIENVIKFINRHLDDRKFGKAFSDRNDFLTKMLSMKESNKVDDGDVFITLAQNIAAGSDTTAVSLSSVVYNLAKHPEKAQKLREEIFSLEKNRQLSNPVTFQEAQKMPYLQAIIKESLRVHPAVGQPLVRIVPPEGAVIAGQFFPVGTEVSTSAWIIHYDKRIFGEDAYEFRPERWLEDKARATYMESQMLAFGSGSRTCIGKNISLLEMSKLIPQLYRQFDIRLEDPAKDWELQNFWFVKQKFNCSIYMLEHQV